MQTVGVAQVVLLLYCTNTLSIAISSIDTKVKQFQYIKLILLCTLDTIVDIVWQLLYI